MKRLLLIVSLLLVGCSGPSFEGAEFHQALKQRHSHLYPKMLDEHPDWVNSQAPDGTTPLHIAANGCDLEAVSFLLGRGAKLDGVDQDGNTPFHLAAQPAALEGDTAPVEGATEKARIATKTFQKGTGVQGKLAAGKYHKQSEILKRFIAREADPSTKNKAGKTPVDLLGQERYLSIKMEVENPGGF